MVEYSAAQLLGSPGRTTFYLVSPAGRKYPFYATRPESVPDLEPLDWSGDRQRIVADFLDSNDQRVRYEQISLVTGTVTTRFSLPFDLLGIEYARPRGSSFLVLGSGTGPWLYRYSLTGKRLRSLNPKATLSAPLQAPDGKFFVAGTRKGLDQISPSGTITRHFRIPTPTTCNAVRWWNRLTVLAYCFGRSPSDSDRLWLVPLGGAAPRSLTPIRRSLSPGYYDAFHLPSGIYLNAANGSKLFIVRQSRDGREHTVHIAGRAGIGDAMVTSRGSRLLIWSGIGVSQSNSLFWYNPTTHAIRYVFRTPPGRFGVSGVIPYGHTA